jgi:small subunit ribosomal protein S16
MGRRHRPFYRLAAMDSRSKRDGRVIEELGFFDPLIKDEEKSLKVNTERAAYWLSVGAKPSDTVRVLLRKSGVDVSSVDHPGAKPKEGN